MFKNKKVLAIVLASVFVAALAFGIVAVTPVLKASAAEIGETVLAHGRPGGPGGRDQKSGDGTYLAEALGITLEELQAATETAREAGKAAREADEDVDRTALLADALGISVTELETAQEAAKEAAIAQAIADGTLTEEQVALMEARQALKDYMDKDTMLASALGITVEELQAAQDEGQRIPDLLEELGLDEETFKANLEAAQTEALNQAIEDGVITQEQADQLQEAKTDGHKAPGGRGGRPDGSQSGERPEEGNRPSRGPGR